MNQHRCSKYLCFSFVGNLSEVVYDQNVHQTGGESYRQDFATNPSRLRYHKIFELAISDG